MPEWTSRVRERLAGLRLDPATEAETIEELAQHVDDRYRDLLARGATDAEADAQAWRELEGHALLAREIAAARTPLAAAPIQNMSRGGFGAIVDDAGFAWRRLRHAPGFVLVAVLTLTLTIGANTAILSVADAVLFRPLPYSEPDSVSIILMRNRKTGGLSTATPYAFLQAVDDGCPGVSDAGLIETGPRVTEDTAEGPQAIPTMQASLGYFRVLGVAPALGRIFSEGDQGHEGRAAMLSFAAWQQRLGGNPNVVGGAVTLGASTFDIVGVLPRGFVFPSRFAGNPQLVTLMAPKPRNAPGGTFHAIVRAAPGVSRERAQAEVDAATAPVSASLPRMTSGPVLMDIRAVLYPVGGPIMRYLLAAAGLILILGCANLANMMLVRGRRTLRETAVRLALGASRARLIRPMVFEALIIGIAGAGLAVATTVLLFDTLLKQVPPAAYGRAPVGVDARVIVASLLMGLIAALVFSIVPAWRSAGVDVLALIQRRAGRGDRRRRLGRPMVIAQVAIAVAVVFGAVIAGRAFVSVLRTPLGFSSDRVLRIAVTPARGATDPQQFYERVVVALTQRRDVESVGAAGGLPFSREAPYDSAKVAGADRPAAGIVFALPGFFEAIAMPVLRGRTFTWDDAHGDETAAVVSASAARALFGNGEALGGTFSDSGGREFHVIGIVGDIRQSLDGATSPPAAYVMPGANAHGLSVIARMRDRHETMVGEIKADLRTLAPPGATVEWWSDKISADNAYRDPRFQTIVLVTLAALALGLTALGIFSVVSYLVSARTREMGVRLAIGATPGALVGLVIRQAMVPVALGLAAGVLLIQWLSRLVEAQFFKVETQDPLIVVAAAGCVVLAALGAAYLPARRATQINPADVLRAE